MSPRKKPTNTAQQQGMDKQKHVNAGGGVRDREKEVNSRTEANVAVKASSSISRGRKDGKKPGGSPASLQSRTRSGSKLNEGGGRRELAGEINERDGNEAVSTRSRGKGTQMKDGNSHPQKPDSMETGTKTVADKGKNPREESGGQSAEASEESGDRYPDREKPSNEDEIEGSVELDNSSAAGGNPDDHPRTLRESSESESIQKSNAEREKVIKDRAAAIELQKRIEFDRLHREQYSPNHPEMRPVTNDLEGSSPVEEPKTMVAVRSGSQTQEENEDENRRQDSNTAMLSGGTEAGGNSSGHPKVLPSQDDRTGNSAGGGNRDVNVGGTSSEPTRSLRAEPQYGSKGLREGKIFTNIGFNRPRELLKRTSNNCLALALDSWAVVSGKHQAHSYCFRQTMGVTTVKLPPGQPERPRARPFSQIRIVTEKMKATVRSGLCVGGKWRWAAFSGSVILLTFSDEADFSVTSEDVEEDTVVELEYTDQEQNLHRVSYLLGDPPKLHERDFINRITTSALYYYKEGRRPVIPANWVNEVNGSVRVPNNVRLGVVDGMVRLTVINEENPNLEISFMVWVVPGEQMKAKAYHMTDEEWLAPFVQFQARDANRITSAVGKNSFVQEMLGIAKQRSTSADSKLERMTVVPRAWFSFFQDSEDFNLVDPVVRTHVGFWKGVTELLDKGSALGRVNVLSPALTKYRSGRKAIGDKPREKGWVQNRPCMCWEELEYPKYLPRVTGMLPTVEDLKSRVYVEWVPRSEESIGVEVDCGMDASEVFAGEGLAAEMTVFAQRCVPEKTPALDMFTSRNIDNMFVMGRIQFEENDLVHKCLSCHFEDYFVAHDQASTWGIELLMERERLRRDGGGRLETFDAMLSVDGVKSAKGRAKVAMRDIFPAIFLANAPTFRKKVAVSTDELIRNSVFTVERQLIESEFYSFAVLAAYHRLDKQVEYLRKKGGESALSKPVQVGGFRMKKKKGTPRAHHTVVGPFFRMAVPTTAGAQFNVAMEVGVNAARVAFRLVHCVLGLRSLACVVKNMKCPEQENRSSFTDHWSFFAAHGWLRMPDAGAVETWGYGANPSIKTLTADAMEDTLFRQYDEGMLCVIHKAFDDIMGLISRVLETDEYDFDFWAAQEEKLRPDAADRLYIGGDMFDLELYQILERHAESVGEGKWDSLGMPLRILRSLTAIRHDELFARAACMGPKVGEKRTRGGKDALRSLSVPIIVREEVCEERLPLKECMKHIHSMSKFLKDGVRRDLKGGVRGELRARLPAVDVNGNEAQGDSQTGEKQRQGEADRNDNEEVPDPIDWREQRSGINVVMDSLQEILTCDKEEGKEDKVIDLIVDTVDLVRSCTRKSKVSSAQVKDMLSRLALKVRAKESAEGQGMMMLKHCATDPETKEALRKETATRGEASVIVDDVENSTRRPKRKRIPSAKALASQRSRSPSPQRSQSLNKRKRTHGEEVIPDTQEGSESDNSGSQYSSGADEQ